MTSKDLIPKEQPFAEIVALIQTTRQRAIQSVNQHLMDLYWSVGQYLSRKLAQAEWGDGGISGLANYIQQTQPNLRGFIRSNLFRMRQFYDIHQTEKKVSPLVRQLSGSHNWDMLSQCKHHANAHKRRWGDKYMPVAAK